MLVYRIAHKKYSETLFASGLEGRWNHEGRKVLYTAENISLAYLETMYARKGLGYNRDFRIMVIQLPDDAKIFDIDAKKLPKNWRDFRAYEACQEIGERWFLEEEYLAMRVPSAVVAANFNIVINTLHPAYKSVRLLETLDFVPDDRIEEVLKKYQ